MADDEWTEVGKRTKKKSAKQQRPFVTKSVSLDGSLRPVTARAVSKARPVARNSVSGKHNNIVRNSDTTTSKLCKFQLFATRVEASDVIRRPLVLLPFGLSIMEQCQMGRDIIVFRHVAYCPAECRCNLWNWRRQFSILFCNFENYAKKQLVLFLKKKGN